ncbi:hypothetical protein [Georgenia sp. SUBG003]|uniref:hypothetical protein n=1 Tax=Georgenia sp. SUBG003 TaxID=1497974 RepID=UPI0006945698
MTSQDRTDRLLLPTRVLLALFAGLTTVAVGALFVRAAETDESFAWTIDPAATAAFLGAGYASGTVLVLLSWHGGSWARTRIPLVTILVFTALTLTATLAHLDRFHLAVDLLLPRFAAWFWLAVYVVVPVGMTVVLVLQQRRAVPPGPRRPLPAWLVTLLVVEGLVLLVVGSALYLAPATAELLWPWPLTPLTARVVGSWLVAYGVAAALLVRAGDLDLLRVPAVAYAVLGVLQLVVAGRFADVVRWGSASALVFLVMATAIAATGSAAFVAAEARPAPLREALQP